ncbi:MAG: hypothetical protein EHM57_06820 [Actinobacteria bacterium]|nr:MAG: hypothetical protein EHM57_06820 [Actinomycetota bacterium]
MADDPGFDELLASPFDQPDSFRVWWPLIVGMAIGVAGVLIGYLAASADASDPVAATTTTAATTVTTTSIPGVALDETSFPPGYSPVSGMVAVKPFAAVIHEDTVQIAFATAVRRGFDEDLATPFNGGRWVLETGSGTSVESTGVSSTFNAPGAFTVVFPWSEAAPPQPAVLRLVEGLTFFDEQGEGEIPFTGLPMTVGGMTLAELPVTTVTVDDLTVTEDEAVLTWSSSEAVPVGTTFTVVLEDASQNTVAQYYDQGGFFFAAFGERRIPDQSSGTVTLPRDRAFQAFAGVETATQARVYVSLEYTVAFPAEAEFDVSELPVIGG